MLQLDRVFWETIPFCQMPHPEFFRHSIDLDFLRSRLNEEKTYIEMTMTGQHIDWEESRKEIKAKGACCTSCLLEKVCEGVWEEDLPLHGEGDLIPITDIAQAEALWSSL